MTMIARWRVVALSLALMLALGYGLLQGRRVSQLDAEIQRQRTERLEAAARADGWTTVWAKSVPDLLAEAADRDSMIARLREEVRIAGAHAVAGATIEATAIVDTVFVADTTTAQHIRWQITQPPFSGMATYYPPNRLGLDLRARIRTELVGVIAPDGRLLVTARTPDPGVTLAVQQLAWDPPEPEGGNPWLWGAIGLAAGAVGWELVRE